MQERTRWARYFSVPMISTTPPNFPPLTLTVMRAINALSHLADASSQTSPAAQKAIIHALDVFFDAYWVRGEVITDKDVLARILGTIVGGEDKVAKVMEVAAGEGKKMLLANSDLAFDEGAFGLPWYVAENDKGEREGFWGVDHLGCLLDFMGLEKPKAGGWKAML